jgi:DNA-directed RNA polymerase specialized sigma subunit
MGQAGYRQGPLDFSSPSKPLDLETQGDIKWPSSGNSRGSKAAVSEADVFSQWKANPTPDNGAALMTYIDPYIRSAVRRHTGSDSPVNVGRAKSMMIDAIGRYDGRASMATFVDRQLLPMQRWAAKHRAGVKVPTSYAQERRKLAQAEQDFETDKGRLPSRAELADYSGISLSRIQKVLSTNLPSLSEKELATSEGFAQAGDQGVEDDGQLWLKSVYYSLNPTNQFIMEHTMGLYGAKPLSNSEIAKKLKISPGAVSQRKANIQKLLNEQ